MGAIGWAWATPPATPSPNRANPPDNANVVVNLVDFLTGKSIAKTVAV
ncbi:MAG: hypothetical protein QOJ80_3597 [Mycobacterium sp.]|jgi:hypothetical protein|nr:hypothetical protein [Mycobacterium sp.]